MGDVRELLRNVGQGSPPPADALVDVYAQPSGASAGVLGFTAHHVVAADVEPEWVRSVLPDEDLSAPLGARFLGALGDRLGREPGCVDAVLVASSGVTTTDLDLIATADVSHPRVQRAYGYRDEVSVYTVDGGMVLVGRGFAGRWEVALEVEPSARGRGLGRRLAAAACGLVPAGESLWAQVSPGNVASLRAFLAAGYAPVGSEVLFVDGRAD